MINDEVDDASAAAVKVPRIPLFFRLAEVLVMGTLVRETGTIEVRENDTFVTYIEWVVQAPDDVAYLCWPSNLT